MLFIHHPIYPPNILLPLFFHFLDEEREIQRDEMFPPRSHSHWVVDLSWASQPDLLQRMVSSPPGFLLLTSLCCQKSGLRVFAVGVGNPARWAYRPHPQRTGPTLQSHSVMLNWHGDLDVVHVCRIYTACFFAERGTVGIWLFQVDPNKHPAWVESETCPIWGLS